MVGHCAVEAPVAPFAILHPMQPLLPGTHIMYAVGNAADGWFMDGAYCRSFPEQSQQTSSNKVQVRLRLPGQDHCYEDDISFGEDLNDSYLAQILTERTNEQGVLHYWAANMDGGRSFSPANWNLLFHFAQQWQAQHPNEMYELTLQHEGMS